MWPETSSSVPWDPPRGSSVPQAETPTRQLACPENRNSSPEISLYNHERPSYRTSAPPKRQMSGQKESKEIDEIQAHKLKTAAKKAIVMKQPNDSKEEELDDIWMKFVFGGDGEDEDIESRTCAGGELGTKVESVSSSSLRANPPSEIRDYSLNHRKRQEDSPTFSTLVHKSNDSQSPLQPKYINSGRRNLIDSSKAHSKDIDLPHDTPSSERDSVSMVAIANSQACSPTRPNKSPLQTPKRKVVFEMPRPFFSS
jgi:hypothetical protein